MWTMVDLATFVVPRRTRVGVAADLAARWTGRRGGQCGEDVRRPRCVGRIGCPRHRATRRGLGRTRRDDEEVELLALCRR
jgi:hypothetical protein